MKLLQFLLNSDRSKYLPHVELLVRILFLLSSFLLFYDFLYLIVDPDSFPDAISYFLICSFVRTCYILLTFILFFHPRCLRLYSYLINFTEPGYSIACEFSFHAVVSNDFAKIFHFIRCCKTPTFKFYFLSWHSICCWR